MVARNGAGIRDRVAWTVRRDRILKDRQAGRSGTYNCRLIAEAAVALDRDPRTIRRWMDHEPSGRKRFELQDLERSYISWCGGDVRAAWEELRKRDLATVAYRTLLRAFNRSDPGVRLGLRGGLGAMAAAMPYLTLPPATHSMEIVEADHAVSLPILLRNPFTNELGHPSMTLLVDVHSRMYVGLSVTLADGGVANTESAFVAIADMLLGHDYDGTFIGGLPDWLRFDQGADFMSGVADAIHRLGGKTQPVEAHRPQAKPYIERAIGTIKRRILRRYKGYDERIGDRRTPVSELLSPADLAFLLGRDLRELNLRLHRGINAIPLDRYRANPGEPTRLDPELIARALLRRNRTAVVQKSGVMFNKIRYVGQATFAHIGEEVGCGYLETRPDFLDIFDSGGEWLGKLHPADDAGKSLARATRDSQRRQIETVQNAQRGAGALRDEFPQLRGGIVEVPGSTPVADRPSRRRTTTSEAADLERRQARLVNSKIWKP